MPTLLLVTASALSLGWWLPQLIRILRRGSAGVSPTTWAIATANVTLWGFWALLAGQPWVVTVEWVQAAGSLLVVLTIGLTRSALIAAGCVAVVVLVAQPWPVVASVAAVASVLAVRGPQLYSLRARPEQHQVSVLSWMMVGVANLLWCAWGASSGHPTMMIGAGVAALSSAVIALVGSRRGLPGPETASP